MSKPLKTFITYSHEDEDNQKRKKLRTYLAVMERNGEIKPRDDTDITAGGKARQEDILKEVANSDILLYLVSAASLASKSCNQELTEAVKVGSRVIPIILESCDWLNDRLSNFQALPDKGEPINKWQPESDGWQNVVDGIREAIEEMQVQTDTPSGTSEQELRAKLAFQHGNVLMMIGQINMAIERYSHAIELNPNHIEPYNNRGIAYGKKGEFDRAIDDFNKAIDLNPDYADAYNNRGIAYNGKSEYDCAIDDYTKAIDLNPNYAQAYNNRGAAYIDKGEVDRAIENYNTAVRLKRDYTEAYHNRGNAYLKKGNFDRAIGDFTKATQLNPNYAEAYYNRGITYGDRGDFDCAIGDFTKATQLNPDYTEAYYNRGLAYWIKGDYIRAIADYTKVIQLKPHDANVYYNRGVAQLHLREWDKARTDLTTARDMGINIIASFHREYGGVAGFQQMTGIQLPADLAEMLTPQQ